MSLCIGLFGTCGNTTFRQDLFVPTYEQNDMAYYNPQVEDWTPDCAKEEANHLANDQIIAFPVTSETYGIGSLAEVGFSILNAIKLDDRRDFIVMIDEKLDDELMEDKDRAKESLRARQLVLAHLKKLNYSNIFLVDCFEDMLELSLVCFNQKKEMARYRKFNPSNRG